MLKLTVAVVAMALVGTASAGWRSMRVDGSSEASFNASVAAIRAELPGARKYVFESALQDIWVLGVRSADAEQREYTKDDYLRQVDGRGYKEIVTLTDPSGDTARARFGAAYARLYGVPRIGGRGTRPGHYSTATTTTDSFGVPTQN